MEKKKEGEVLEERVDPERNIRNFRRRNYFRRKRRGKEARSIRRGGNNKDSRHDEKKESCWDRRYSHGSMDIRRINYEERTDGNFDAGERKKWKEEKIPKD